MDKTSIMDTICERAETRKVGKVGKISKTENSDKSDGTAEMGKMGRQLKQRKDKIMGKRKSKCIWFSNILILWQDIGLFKSVSVKE